MQPHLTSSPPTLALRPHAYFAMLLVAVGVVLAASPSEAAHFHCAEVTCLIDAITQANANGQDNTIVLAAGTYTLTAVDNETDGPNGLPSVTGTLTIRGAGADLTTISRPAIFPLPPGVPPTPRFRLLHVAPGGALTVRGVTLTGGELPGDGSEGAGLLSTGVVTIIDSVISSNGGIGGLGTFGGGVAGGTVVIRRSTISRNVARSGGGGVFIGEGGTLTVTGSVISSNQSGFGGGIRFVSSGALAIRDTRVLDNISGLGGGGGLEVGNSAGGNITTIRRSTIAGNSGFDGAGIGYHSPEGRLEITHSAIVGNQTRAGGSAAGIAFTAGTVTIAASTIANNSAGPFFGTGGIVGSSPGRATVTNSSITGNTVPWTLGEASRLPTGGVSGPIRLQNSIVAGNTATDKSSHTRPSDCGESIESLGNNLFGDPTGCGAVVSDRLGDPGLGALLDPGRAGSAHVPLLPGSQAIDAGENAVCGAIDQQGLTRPIDGNGDGVRTCDIGAVEFYPVVNDLVVLEGLRSTYVPPSAREQSNPLTAGGTFEITAVFTTAGAQDICHVGFQVMTLRAEGGGSPALLTRRGALIGGEGVIVPARIAAGKENLRADRHDQYRFTIGLAQKEPVTFLVNVVGEARGGCRQ